MEQEDEDKMKWIRNLEVGDQVLVVPAAAFRG
jgi:hypothetical protein